MQRLDRLIDNHVLCDPVTLTVIGIGVGVGATVHATEQQREAASDARKAARAQKRSQDIKASRERRKQIRQAQVAQAEISSAAVASGGAGSSSVSQASGSVRGQLASNLSFLDNIQQLSDTQSIFMEKASKHRDAAATSSAVAGLAFKATSLIGPPGG